MPVILATQEAEIRRIYAQFEASPRGRQFPRPYLKKIQHTKKGLIKWFKC
jgi:hypothetical protein